LNFLLFLFVAQSAFVPWGIKGNTTLVELAEAFAPTGDFENADWKRSIDGDSEILRYECQIKKGCRSHPRAAQFYFSKKKLVSADLTFSGDQGSGSADVAMVINQALTQAGDVVATAKYVGRYTRYFSVGPWSAVWIQDGPQARVKLYLDQRNPVGRAEAVAAGAQLDLSAFPGASSYSKAHRLLMDDRWASAMRSFEQVLKTPGISSMFARQTRFVLAMTIAADLKSTSKTAKAQDKAWRADALRKLRRAQKLAPSLKAHFAAMIDEFSLR